MAGLFSSETECLLTDYERQTDGMVLSQDQQALVNSEKTRGRAEANASHAAEGKRLVGEIDGLRSDVLAGLTDVTNDYAATETAYELGDISHAEKRGRIQVLQRREVRLEEQQEALQMLLNQAEKHSATDPVEYAEAIFRKYRGLPRPRFKMPR